MGLSTIGTPLDADVFLDTVDTVDDIPSTDDQAPLPAPKRRATGPWVLVAAIVGGGLLALNIALLMRVANLQTQIDAGFAAVDQNVDQLAGSVGNISQMVDEFEGQLESINALALAGTGEASAAPEQALQVGAALPRFDPSVQDPALGVQIAGLGGTEYYTGERLDIDAADGKARAWLVWAHWCPYCQQEMPELKAWVEANAADFPDFELVSLTTAIDESRGNPLLPYLEELQLPFPVIVDGDGSLSAQLGLNAFPFWVFTGPDGTVLGRTAGLLGPDRFESIAQQLQDIAGSA